VKELEAGKRNSLEDSYPQELAPLVDNLQALISTERQQRERYRDTLADLAHSLKTPLAIISGLPVNPQTDKSLQEQVERMNEIVDYQLQRAVTASSHRFMQQVDAASVIQRIVAALNKVYRDKNIGCQTSELKPAFFIGDERDLMEVLGNLLDNAYKYTHDQVAITLSNQGDSSAICISIEDNGDGIDPARQQQILQRGQRADSRQAGQGIGLAVAMDIITSYQGTLTISRSKRLGGACFTLSLPGKRSI
jgi:two-component system sensor histidine kinase PhoQ